jgi:hypothetical protein
MVPRGLWRTMGFFRMLHFFKTEPVRTPEIIAGMANWESCKAREICPVVLDWSSAMSDVLGLNDNCFVLAGHAFIEIANAMKEELGRKPTLGELCEVLAWGFQSCSEEVLDDVHPGRIESVTCKLRPGKIQRLSPGDLVAVPASDGKYYLGVFITKNRFGHAFGFFRGLWPRRPPKVDVVLVPCGLPIYTGLHSLWDGTWRLVGHRSDLLAHFDADPEIYHAKRHHPQDDRIGEFGAAERASDELRSIDASEAVRVGLLDGSYESGVLAKMIANVLKARGCGTCGPGEYIDPVAG